MAANIEQARRLNAWRRVDDVQHRLGRNLKVSCVAKASELPSDRVDLIVFPEYTEPTEIELAVTFKPSSIIVSALHVSGRCRGLMLHEGRNLIDYIKIGSDGFTQGTGQIPDHRPVVEFTDHCIGVVICMDAQDGLFLNEVLSRVRSSHCRNKFLCIPACMGSWWFGEHGIYTQYGGVSVVLCNNTGRQDRCKSFIMDSDGRRLATQQNREPISYELG